MIQFNHVGSIKVLRGAIQIVGPLKRVGNLYRQTCAEKDDRKPLSFSIQSKGWPYGKAITTIGLLTVWITRKIECCTYDKRPEKSRRPLPAYKVQVLDTTHFSANRRTQGNGYLCLLSGNDILLLS